MAIFLFFVAVWYTSLFSQTFFQHRYAAHGAFKMSRGWERVFFVLAYLTQGSSYMIPRAYAIMHRYHYAYTDTELDPHSPTFSRNIFSMMWRTRGFYRDIVNGTMQVEARFEKNLLSWPAFNRWANSTLSRVIWVGLYTAVFALLVTHPLQWLYLPVILTMGAFHGAIINWFAHKYGYINFRLKNTSLNLFFIDVFMLGDSYHHHHHRPPSAINFGRRWHEIDPVYPVIRLLAWMKIVRPVKTAPVTAAGPGGVH